MDEFTSKRSSGKIGFTKKGSNLTFRNPNHEDRSIQHCSRLGYSTKFNPTKDNHIGQPEKFKYPKASFHSTNSRTLAASSSSDFNRSHQERHNKTSLRETDIAESSSKQGMIKDLRRYDRQQSKVVFGSSSRQEIEDSEFFPSTSGIHSVQPDSDNLESAVLQGFPTTTTEALGNAMSTSRPRKQINRRVACGKQEASGLSVRTRSSFTTRSTNQASKLVSQGMDTAPQRYGLKNLGCTSIADILPSGCSPSNFGNNGGADYLSRKPSDGESSSTAAKAISRTSNNGYSSTGHSSLSGLLPENSSVQQTSRRNRNQSTKRDAAVSVRTRRSPTGGIGMRSAQEDGYNVSPSETIVIPQLPQTQFSIPEAVSGTSSSSIPPEQPNVFCDSLLSSATSWTARSRSSSRLDGNITQSFHRHQRDRDGYRRFNLEAIAEVLLALERIEQEEELTYEQLLVLETSLFIGGLSFYDQHRDMRMDIDSMSYEELLALEEKIGTVSTALSEEALRKCLKRSIYLPAPVLPGISCNGDEDVKCSICQEEYAIGEELGKLACDHRYHADCIYPWLRQKNWCPICKTPAEKKH